jgi:hypothetical protein
MDKFNGMDICWLQRKSIKLSISISEGYHFMGEMFTGITYAPAIFKMAFVYDNNCQLALQLCTLQVCFGLKWKGIFAAGDETHALQPCLVSITTS